MCKILKFPFYLQALSWDQQQKEYDQKIKSTEDSINKWLASGWKLSQTVFDSNNNELLVFLTK